MRLLVIEDESRIVAVLRAARQRLADLGLRLDPVDGIPPALTAAEQAAVVDCTKAWQAVVVAWSRWIAAPKSKSNIRRAPANVGHR